MFCKSNQTNPEKSSVLVHSEFRIQGTCHLNLRMLYTRSSLQSGSSRAFPFHGQFPASHSENNWTIVSRCHSSSQRWAWSIQAPHLESLHSQLFTWRRPFLEARAWMALSGVMPASGISKSFAIPGKYISNNGLLGSCFKALVRRTLASPSILPKRLVENGARLERNTFISCFMRALAVLQASTAIACFRWNLWGKSGQNNVQCPVDAKWRNIRNTWAQRSGTWIQSLEIQNKFIPNTLKNFR